MMWASELVKKYDLNYDDLEAFLIREPRIQAKGAFNNRVFDTQILNMEEYEVVDLYLTYLAEKGKLDMAGKLAGSFHGEVRKKADEIAEKARQKVRREEEKSEAITKMLISSGFNFDGYRIVKYSGYISGDDATQIPRSGIFGGNNGQNLTDALVKIRIQALKELKEAAYDLGCNAVIGVDFDYLTLEPETRAITGGTLYEPYVICVTANGNAVVVEKIEG